MSISIDKFTAFINNYKEVDLIDYIKNNFVTGFDCQQLYYKRSWYGLCIVLMNGILRKIKPNQSGGDRRLRKCFSYMIDTGELKIIDSGKLEQMRLFARTPPLAGAVDPVSMPTIAQDIKVQLVHLCSTQSVSKEEILQAIDHFPIWLASHFPGQRERISSCFSEFHLSLDEKKHLAQAPSEEVYAKFVALSKHLTNCLSSHRDKTQLMLPALSFSNTLFEKIFFEHILVEAWRQVLLSKSDCPHAFANGLISKDSRAAFLKALAQESRNPALNTLHVHHGDSLKVVSQVTMTILGPAFTIGLTAI